MAVVVGAPPGHLDASLPIDTHPVVRARQILAHHQPLHAASCDSIQRRQRDFRGVRLHHRALDFADQLNSAPGDPISEVSVEIVDRNRLLEGDVVLSKRVDSRDMGVVVHHVVAPHQTAAVGQSSRMRAAGRCEQQRSTIGSTSGDHESSPGYA